MTQDKPTIEDVLKKHLGETNLFALKRNFPMDYKGMEAAMTEYASLNRQGCRWVKVKEKGLPEKPLDVHWRFSDGKPACNQDIEYLIRKNRYQNVLDNLEYLDESIEPCATSSENYWKQRCELSELMYLKLNMSEYHGELYEEWEKLRQQTPSPTGDRDCEELKKEVERLKGEGDWAYILKLETEIERRYDLIKELFGGIGIGNEKSEKEWQTFKTENNL